MIREETKDMEKIKFNNEVSLELYVVSSTSAHLTFAVLDDVRNGLEEICKDAENTEVIKMISVNDIGDETTLKGYAGYTNLVSMKTEYGVTTNIDYDTTDSTTASGFAEEKHDITTVVLAKPTQVETMASAIEELQKSQAELQESQAEQDETIAEILYGGEE